MSTAHADAKERNKTIARWSREGKVQLIPETRPPRPSTKKWVKWRHYDVYGLDGSMERISEEAKGAFISEEAFARVALAVLGTAGGG